MCTRFLIVFLLKVVLLGVTAEGKQETCPKPSPKNVNFACYKGNIRLKCDTIPVFVNGDAVRLSCAPHFRPDRPVSYKKLTCNNGKWSDEFFNCIPDCGKTYKQLIKYSSTITSENLDKIPWHVAIYDTRDKETAKMVCGGTIVSERLVITAARCFHNDLKKTKIKSIRYEIVVGKFSNHFQAASSADQRSYKIQQIIISSKESSKRKVSGLTDTSGLAMLITREEMQFNVAVLPACIDLTKLKFDASVSKMTGKVVTLGDEKQESVSAISLPYINYTLCEAMIGNRLESPLAAGTFCSDTKTDFGVHRISTGSGYLVLDTKTSTYYIHGVLTSRSIVADNGSVIAIFTDLNQRFNWISKISPELDT